MVDNMGNWTAEKDYKNYPREKMCDMDYIAEAVLDYINENNYKIKTDIENVCYMALLFLTDNENRYEIEEDKEDIKIFFDLFGGISEFDYYA